VATVCPSKECSGAYNGQLPPAIRHMNSGSPQLEIPSGKSGKEPHYGGFDDEHPGFNTSARTK
jgi:hypothetical protein